MTTIQQCILHNLFCVGPSQAMHILDTVHLLVRQHLDNKHSTATCFSRFSRCAVNGCRQPGPRSGFCSAHWVYYPEAVMQEYQSITPEEWAGIMQLAWAQFPPLPMFQLSSRPPKPTPPRQPRKDRPVRHFRTYSVRDEKKAPQHPVTRCGDAGGLTAQGRPCPYLVYGQGKGKCHLHSATSSFLKPMQPDAPPSPVPFTPFAGIPRLDLNQIDPLEGAATPPILPHRAPSHDEA